MTSLVPQRDRAFGGRIALVLLFAFGVMLVMILLAPLLFKMTSFDDALVRQFEARTGQRIVANEMKLSLFPRPRLSLRDVHISDAASQAVWLSAAHVELTVLPWPLTWGQVQVDHVIIEHPHLVVRHRQWGKWHIGESRQTSDAPAGAPVGRLPFAGSLLIVDGTVTLVNEAVEADLAGIRVTSLQAAVTEDIPGRRATFQMTGEIPQSAVMAPLSVEGSIVAVAATGAAREDTSTAYGLYVDGDVRLYQVDVQFLANRLGMPTASNRSAMLAQAMAHLRLLPRATGYDLVATEWRVGVAELALHGTASLTGLGTDVRRLSATITAPSVPIKQTLDQVPADWLPTGFRDRLTRHAVDGMAALYDTHIEGTLSETSRFTITGGIEIRDGRFFIGPSHPAVRDVFATIVYDLDQIRVTTLRGQYGPLHVTDGMVMLTDWRREPTADVRMSAEARAADMIALLNDERMWPELDRALLPVEQVTGDVQLDAHFLGQPVTGQMSLVEGAVTIRNLGFRHQAVEIPWRQFQARLTVLPTEVRIESLHGQAGPITVEAAGRISYPGQPRFNGMVVKAAVEGQDVLPWFGTAGNGGVKPDVAGPIVLSAAMRGEVQSPGFQATLTLDGTAIEIPNVLTKLAGVPAGIRVDGKLTGNRVLLVRRGEMIFPPMRIAGNGYIELWERMNFQVSFLSEALSLKNLPRGVSLGAVEAGIIQTSVNVRGQLADRTTWFASGRLQFNHGIVRIAQLDDPIKDVAIGLRFDGKHMDIRRMAFMLGNSDVRISGSVTDWMDSPRAKLVVQSWQIDARSLRVRTAAAPVPHREANSTLASWWANGQLEVTLLADYVYYDRFLLTGVSCRVRLERGAVTVDRISADTNDGHVGGRLAVTLPDRGHSVVRTTFRVSGVPVERLLSPVGDAPPITGWLTAAGRMQAEFESDRVLRGSINSRRPISVLLEDGRIYHVPVLTKLLALMNLPAILEGKVDLTKRGMPVDRAKAVFSVEDGMIKVREFLLDSPILKISGSGRYDFIEDQFDALLVTSPLGQYSDLLKSIPLFGKLFAGKRTGFDTAIFEVKGSAKDPSVVYLPAESLMAGVKGTAQLAVDLLVNAAKLPKEAFTMVEEVFGDEETP